jgi:gamma-glutamyltranspeptidase / glutathione hydrolase
MPRATSPRWIAVLVLAAVASTTAIVPRVEAASRRPEVGARGMVVGPDRAATEVGLEVLRGGGNAVDAAVATAFALAVTYPRAGNLGGGGFLLYRAPGARYAALDFRETAPAALTPKMFVGADGRIDPMRSQEGGLAVAVPGSVAGLADAHARWGSRPWAELLAPAIRLAEEGFAVSAVSAAYFLEENARLAADPGARALFTRDGRPLVAGDRVVQKDLARTLRAIAARGPKAFYEGPVAQSIVTAVAGRGGVMTLADLSAYRPVTREPLIGAYRGHRVVTFPLPSSGGIVLLQILAMLERFDMSASGAGSSLTLHRIAEAERRAFADRSRFLGDPAFVTVPVQALLDRAYLASRSATIRDDRATPSTEVLPGAPAGSRGTQTLHLSTADARGGAVALTTTLNSWFGAAIVASGTGVILNNEIDDFSLASGVANQYGLVGESANAVAGGKRPLSSMSPTIVEQLVPGARPLLVLGSPGGPRIISSVLQTLLHVVDDGFTLQEAVDAPRIHHQWTPDALEIEPHGVPEDVAAALRARGHTLKPRALMGNVGAIGIDDQGRWTGAPDPRDEAAAAGY